MGLVPVHVHDGDDGDDGWLPYELTVWPRVGFSSSVSQLPSLLRRLAAMDPLVVGAMETEALAYRASHFESDGILKQISMFLTAPRHTLHGHREAKGRRVAVDGSDLVCRPLPRYPTMPEALMATVDRATGTLFGPGIDPGCVLWSSDMLWENDQIEG